MAPCSLLGAVGAGVQRVGTVEAETGFPSDPAETSALLRGCPARSVLLLQVWPMEVSPSPVSRWV